MRLQALASDGFSVRAPRPGRAVIKVHYTPFWVSSGPGCVSEVPDGWTLIHADEPGTIKVRAEWGTEGVFRRSDCGRPRPRVAVQAPYRRRHIRWSAG